MKRKSFLVPKELRVDVLPSGKLGAVTMLGFPDSYPERPEILCCDCCLEKFDRHWFYRHRGFCVSVPPSQHEFLAGEWAFCVYCHALIGNATLLTARVSSLNPGLPRDWLQQLYETLLQCLEGKAQYWEAGMQR